MCLFVYVYVICGQKIVVHGHPSHCGNPFAGYITHHKSLWPIIPNPKKLGIQSLLDSTGVFLQQVTRRTARQSHVDQASELKCRVLVPSAPGCSHLWVPFLPQKKGQKGYIPWIVSVLKRFFLMQSIRPVWIMCSILRDICSGLFRDPQKLKILAQSLTAKCPPCIAMFGLTGQSRFQWPPRCLPSTGNWPHRTLASTPRQHFIAQLALYSQCSNYLGVPAQSPTQFSTGTPFPLKKLSCLFCWEHFGVAGLPPCPACRQGTHFGPKLRSTDSTKFCGASKETHGTWKNRNPPFILLIKIVN